MVVIPPTMWRWSSFHRRCGRRSFQRRCGDGRHSTDDVDGGHSRDDVVMAFHRPHQNTFVATKHTKIPLSVTYITSVTRCRSREAIIADLVETGRRHEAIPILRPVSPT